jgi:hypothetical protein
MPVRRTGMGLIRPDLLSVFGHQTDRDGGPVYYFTVYWLRYEKIASSLEFDISRSWVDSLLSRPLPDMAYMISESRL